MIPWSKRIILENSYFIHQIIFNSLFSTVTQNSIITEVERSQAAIEMLVLQVGE